MKLILIVGLALVAGYASAEEKNCTVKGMHCEACVDMVKDRICEGQSAYETCEVTIKKGSKPKVGILHIKTKDAGGKVDEKALGTAMADTTYKIDKCSSTKM